VNDAHIVSYFDIAQETRPVQGFTQQARRDVEAKRPAHTY
jgi:hypothetical protein